MKHLLSLLHLLTIGVIGLILKKFGTGDTYQDSINIFYFESYRQLVCQGKQAKDPPLPISGRKLFVWLS
jgi:hypothetical protein